MQTRVQGSKTKKLRNLLFFFRLEVPFLTKSMCSEIVNFVKFMHARAQLMRPTTLTGACPDHARLRILGPLLISSQTTQNYKNIPKTIKPSEMSSCMISCGFQGREGQLPPGDASHRPTERPGAAPLVLLIRRHAAKGHSIPQTFYSAEKYMHNCFHKPLLTTAERAQRQHEIHRWLGDSNGHG